MNSVHVRGSSHSRRSGAICGYRSIASGRPTMRTLLALLALALSTAASQLYAADQTQVTWYGQSAFKIVTPRGHVLFVDPWLKNPMNKEGQEDFDSIDKADLILVSHGHFDHVGGAAEIAKKTKARLVATFDLGANLVTYGGFPKAQM